MRRQKTLQGEVINTGRINTLCWYVLVLFKRFLHRLSYGLLATSSQHISKPSKSCVPHTVLNIQFTIQGEMATQRKALLKTVFGTRVHHYHWLEEINLSRRGL